LGPTGSWSVVGGVVSVDVPAAARAVGRPATAAWRLAVSQLHPPACAYAHVEKGSLRAGPLRPCCRPDGGASRRSSLVYRAWCVQAVASDCVVWWWAVEAGLVARSSRPRSAHAVQRERVQASSVASQSGRVCQSRRATSGISGAVIGRRGAATPRLLLASPIRAGWWGRRCRRGR
jgi:hypothetical protein